MSSLWLLFSCSVASNSLWPHGLQHSRIPCPSPSPGVCSNSCPLNQWCHTTIVSFYSPFSSCPQSFPASGSFPMSWLFASGGQNVEASASASVLPMNIHGWLLLGLTGLVSYVQSTLKSLLNCDVGEGSWEYQRVLHSAQHFYARSATTAAAAKSLQLCLTLCDPIEGSLPGSPVPGILQARTLEWVAISFSSGWKWKVKVKSLSRVRLLASAWTAAHQAPPSMGFSRQEYWSGVPFPSPWFSW